jgi:hypothetical protein
MPRVSRGTAQPATPRQKRIILWCLGAFFLLGVLVAITVGLITHRFVNAAYTLIALGAFYSLVGVIILCVVGYRTSRTAP